jgi:cell wall-associated NlpC family hydrolase
MGDGCRFAGSGYMKDNAPMRIWKMHLFGAGMALLVSASFVASPLAHAEDAVPSTPAAPSSVVSEAANAASGAWQAAQDLTARALGLLGIRYRWGGATPQTGLDCSGLVQFVFQEVTGVTLPRSARELSRIGDKISLPDLKPGDLVFFNTRRFAYSHVGIYLGDNRFIHAPRRGREVEVATIDGVYWARHFDGARRLMGVLPGMIPSIVSTANAAPLAEPPDAEDDAQ